MGRKARPTPARLYEKLLQIRTTLGLSQSEMFRRLEVDDLITHKQISKYELGITEPPLPVILQYAHAAGVCVEVLIDDQLELPAKLPARRKHH